MSIADEILKLPTLTAEMIIDADDCTGSTHMTERKQWGRLMAEQLAAVSREAVLRVVADQPDVHFAIKAQCERCREGYTPHRHENADYIPNFTNVEVGDWTHPCTLKHDWKFCEAAEIHEALYARRAPQP